jgi:pimeloyl-ACP methyl ester carboxylesterase
MTSTEREARTAPALAITRWGESSTTLPLLLLHGIGGLGQDWAVVARRLASDREVIAPDARGHGDSPWSPDEAYHTDAHFSDIARLLDTLHIERCVLAGYSMGGGVAILTAAALEERVAGLVVVDAYPAPEMTAGSREIARAMARYADGPPLLPGGRPRFDPAIARRMSADLDAGRPRTDLWPMWDALLSPTLVVRGEQSVVLPAPLAAEMMERQPHASLLTIAGCGHQVLFRRPNELATAIREFARGCDALRSR